MELFVSTKRKKSIKKDQEYLGSFIFWSVTVTKNFGIVFKGPKFHYARRSFWQLARSSESLQGFSSICKNHHFQERVKECCKQSQDPGYFARSIKSIYQLLLWFLYLSIIYMIFIFVNLAKHCSCLILQVIERNLTVNVTVTWNITVTVNWTVIVSLVEPLLLTYT